MTRVLIVGLFALSVAIAGGQRAFAQHERHEHDHKDDTTPEQSPASDAAERSQHAEPARELPPFIPPISEATRRAAFPDVEGHAVHDQALNYLMLFDQLEWQAVEGGGLNLDTKGWIGGDRDRLWFRVEAKAARGERATTETHVFYGHQFARWWDVVAGVRQDIGPGPARTWLAVGIQGLAPYWIDLEATGYVGSEGRTHLRLEAEYELLLTNRLVLQPSIEAEIFGKGDPERRIGAGLSTTDAGLRLRYEIRRELAPYVGLSWSRRWGSTSDLAKSTGGKPDSTELVAGLRLWF